MSTETDIHLDPAKMAQLKLRFAAKPRDQDQERKPQRPKDAIEKKRTPSRSR